ncbi:hypothetical protein [Moraxella nonliquefaciens]|uniref:Uncharacterized protein n=1 Tax=Moraxella nonliquefaciens TaxID=478 RepID=A0A7T3EZH4_MORNO|nr:hypothetical protein [Moraxella nonliquefaciens]QPT44353.1 hypothetical protein I6G26_09915 [Moraxella nonliquefaciens]QQC29373.1 hypothetical protein I6H63_08700 [Moraxella nonliquefaciens]
MVNAKGGYALNFYRTYKNIINDEYPPTTYFNDLNHFKHPKRSIRAKSDCPNS